MIACRGLAALTVLLLAGCATVTPQPVGTVYPQPPAGSLPDGSPVPGDPTAPPVSPQDPVPVPEVKPPLLPSYPRNVESSGAAAPVLSLVRQSRELKKSGKPEAAAAALERALRLEPRNPWVWQALAALHLQLGQAEQAESEALKSNSLGRRNPWIEVENWRLIAAARGQRGNANGAAQAELRHEELQRLLTRPPYAP